MRQQISHSWCSLIIPAVVGAIFYLGYVITHNELWLIGVLILAVSLHAIDIYNYRELAKAYSWQKKEYGRELGGFYDR